MKDKEKQIEEMAITIKEFYYREILYSILPFGKDSYDILAEKLYNAGYRKLDNHAIMVLRKAKGMEDKIRKETAEKILQIIKEEYGYIGNLEKIITKQFGVEIKE